MLLHASCVAVNSRAVVIAGASGSGKSDMALRLIDGGALLVADDQTCLTREGDIVMAFAPASLQGLIEARHVGLLRLPFAKPTPVALYVELATKDKELERLPEEDSIMLCEKPIRRVHLPAFATSTPAKIRLLLAYGTEKSL